MTLAEIFADAETMLAFEPEEIGGALVEILNGKEGTFSQTDFTHPLFETPGGTAGWPQTLQHQVQFAVAEALAWLASAGLVMPDFTHPAGGGWFRMLTKRGRQIRSRTDARSYRDAALLPPGPVHPEILPKAHPAFLRGDYEVAVFAAFRAVEVAVRKAGGFREDELGVKMMRDAFNPDRGPLTDMTVVSVKEREAVSNLFAGAIGAAKNPASHREVEMDRTEAVRLILFASYLISVVDGRIAAAKVEPNGS